MRRRLLAVVALVAGAASLALAVAVVVSEFPRGLVVVACIARRRHGRLVRGAAPGTPCARSGSIVAGLALAGAVVLLVTGRPLLDLLVVAGVLVALAAACATLVVNVDLPDAPAAAAPRALLQPEVGRRQGGALRPGRRGARARHRADRVRPPGDLEHARARRGRRRRRRAGDGRRRRLAGRSSPRSPPSTTCPTPASRPARATTSRSTSGSTATTSSARSTRSSTAASAASTSPRSTAASSSTTSRSGLYAEAVQREGYREAKLRTILDTVPEVLGPERRGARPALDRARRPRAPLRRGDPRLQQPLPARPCGRLGHPAADRRRPARDHRRRRALRPRRRGRGAAAAVARVVRAVLRGRRGPPGPGRHRRRGARARGAAALPDPPRRPARAHRAPAPRRLAVGERARGPVGRRRAARGASRSGATRNPNHQRSTVWI